MPDPDRPEVEQADPPDAVPASPPPPEEAAAVEEAPVEEEARAAGEEITREVPAGFFEVVTRRGWRQTVLVPALAVITALAVGALIIIFTDEESLAAWGNLVSEPGEAFRAAGRAVADAYRALLTGALGSPVRIAEAFRTGEDIARAFNPLSETLVVATPLVLTGLAVAVAFQARLFNIGAEGQITVGAIAASVVGFTLGFLPGPVHLALIVLAGFVGGAVWGGIPGVLKARTGAHEVIVTIMMNFIGAFLALYLLSTEFFRRPDRTDPISKPNEALFPHLFGASTLRVHVGLLVALGVAAGVAWLLNRTTVGFEFKAVGANPDAARAAGIKPTTVFMAIMALGGGLAGLAGANQLASVTPSLTPGFSSGLGFDGITIALLGRARPVGVILSALLFGILRAGSRAMQAATQTPVDIVVVVQALVVVFIAAPALIQGLYRIRAQPPTAPPATPVPAKAAEAPAKAGGR